MKSDKKEVVPPEEAHLHNITLCTSSSPADGSLKILKLF